MDGNAQQAPIATHQESIGRDPAELQAGFTIEHGTARTVQDFDNATLALLSMNTHPSHIDYEFAAGTQFGRPLVVSPLLVSSLTAIFLNDYRHLAFTSLEIRELTFLKPTFPGHTVRVTSKVVERTDAELRVGIEGHKRDEGVFCTFELVLGLREGA